MQVNRRDFIAIAGLAGAAAPACALADQTESAAEAQATAVMTSELSKLPWSFEVAPEPIDESSVAETVEADVVVLGAGTAGLVTAVSAQEEGLDVVLVSASSQPISRGGSNNAIYSKVMERLNAPKQDPWYIEKEIAEQVNSVNTALWYKYYNNSETAMNWLIDLMADEGYDCTLEGSSTLDASSLYSEALAAHAFIGTYGDEDYTTPGMTQPLLVNVLADRFQAKGGTIYYNNIGRQLVRGGVANGTEGRVDAVIAEREDGTYAKYVGSRAVVLATGDFSNDREMMHKYVPWFADQLEANYDNDVNYDAQFVVNGIYKGDGQKMGLWVGAAWQRNFPNCIMGGSISAGPAPTYGESFSGLMVNRDGERFMNELCGGTMAGRTYDLLPGKVVYALWDASLASKPDTWFTGKGWDRTPTSTEDVLADWDSSAEAGTYVKGDTIEEVIEKLGLPVEETLATVERYNELCTTGEDSDFYKPAEYMLAIEQGPFYGAKSGDAGFLTVLGGLRTSNDFEVCDADDNPIPGLYNVGTMVGDFYFGTYTFQMEGINYGACCDTFGYLLGKHLAQVEA